jgi:NAD(P)-dependent dehydrogenase (short-subunit alcohol dehydrogenase family)
LITGGCGFLGVSTAARLLAQAPDRRIVLSDIVRHPRMERLSGDVTFVAADLSDPEASQQLVTRDVGTVFHYASLVSGGAERDYVCPVPPEARMPILNVRNCVGVLIGMAELPPGALGDYRAINGPSIAPSAREIADANQ